MNCGSFDFAPRPAVSEKLEPPTLMPVSTASPAFVPTVTSTGPPKPVTVTCAT